MPRESCPYCGEMTAMQRVSYVIGKTIIDKEEKNVLAYRWVSGSCEHCGKNLAAVAEHVPVKEDTKPNLKAKPEDLP